MANEKSILDIYPNYEVNIGMEVHVQLNTKSKIFCFCSNDFTHQPNTNICPICTGQPGVLPILNEDVIKFAIKAGLATNCTISQISKFDRKHYFYPDLPKNYQITQNEYPICTNGHIPIRLEDGSTKLIPIIRIHIEEDAGKNIHAESSDESFVDLNRSGTPLLEIVSRPVISNSYEAREYLKQLRLTILYLGISSGNMEEGAFRADTNISVRKKGSQKLGTKCELKNINSFKFISDAIEYEIERQINLLESGKQVLQETRSWDSKNKKSFTLRSKEEAADYRYMTEPDLPYIKLESATIDQIRKELPELPNEKFERLTTKLGLTAYEAEIIVNDIALANYYEKATAISKSKNLINWILRDLMGYLNEEKITIEQCKVTPERLAQLMDLLDQNKINNVAAKEIFSIMSKTGQEPQVILKERKLEQITDISELETIIRKIIEQNPEQVNEFKSGKEKVFSFFVGQVMKDTKGKGDPQIINKLLKDILSKE